MNLTPNLIEALDLARTDRFSGVRVRALRDLYDDATAEEKPYIAELFEVFVSLVQTPDDLEVLSTARV